jgi:hypothetical protein
MEEFTPGGYRIEGRDLQGRSVSMTGDDPEKLLRDARAWAVRTLTRSRLDQTRRGSCRLGQCSGVSPEGVAFRGASIGGVSHEAELVAIRVCNRELSRATGAEWGLHVHRATGQHKDDGTDRSLRGGGRVCHRAASSAVQSARRSIARRKRTCA